MKFYSFHLMPWPYLEENFRDNNDSAWVTLSNSNYDPKRGAQLYKRYIDELAYADQLGFDGVCVNEHHQNAYGNMPSPNIIATMLVEKVKGKIAVVGNAIPLREDPVRIAEEIAMLDLLSGGRIISGFVRGLGAEYHSFSKNPTESRERFHEAHKLIIDAWTKQGPFEHYGKYYKFRYVNPWPIPIQKPHPPVWIPSQGSSETVAWTAEKKYTYVQTYSSIDTIRRVFKQFKEEANKCGYEASPEQMGWALPVYVADTDKKAMKEAEHGIDYLFNQAFKMPHEIFFPAGYLTLNSIKNVLKAKKGIGTTKLAFEYLVDKEYVLVGSPETVRQKLAKYQEEFGFGNLLPMMQFGTLSHEKTMENIKLFAEKVIPSLKPLGEQAVIAN
ncbi:LLM class flavin-dependent oxidoreductase [Peribacillus cavernae]|uniref:LLM class flavin-dependent oxidoreductase n=1 Tax=Peribacillus cavernae TaxID=1674310 RepID=A0A433HRJ1_9BACI|nr:LLM class flavin-dependent oxidoreductase [Peribacillus cavernae]MDQ0218644.1 alkanesulfonate monooxygenase SsuD/methylene tetrahydromethanopterin reductase-like flavin-dependent oxidoreductase (luciferase family) [Peribacillus cavernae]RUQ30872.1 LLM class flavin-dependent oxidoreductase [Peribacillus cavernae]